MSKSFRLALILALTSLGSLCLSSLVGAVPPIPGTYNPETMTFYDSGLQVPVEPCHPAPLRAPSAYRTLWHCPVIFIHAADKPPTFEVSEWADQLFTIGTHPTGSMRDYYKEVSYNQFDMDGGSIGPMGWITADYNYEHYHQNNYGFNGGAAEMAQEACLKADAMYDLDWSQFDNDGDGVVDGLIIIHQGAGGEGGSPNQIWSHVGIINPPLEFDGVIINRYSIQPETRGGNSMETIGTICHEFGHMMGLPDLYDTAYTTKPTPIGKWCMMAEGSSIGSPYGSKPSHFCGWAKYKLGWVNPITIDSVEGIYQAGYIQNNNDSAYILPINNNPAEYFFIENRWSAHSLQFDHLPSRFTGGLLIYHAFEEYEIPNSGNLPHWRLVLEDATPGTVGDLADAGFSADENRPSFTRTTDPNTDGYELPSNIDITSIGNRGETMSFRVNLYPTIIMDSYELIPAGNNTYDINVVLKNMSSADGETIEAVISTDAQNVVFDRSSCEYEMIPKNGGTASNQEQPFRFHVTNDSSSLEFFTIIASGPNYHSADLTFTLPINPSSILIIDDDVDETGEPGNVEVFYQEPLDQLALSYETWDVHSMSYPPISILRMYDLVIWEDGIYADNAPTDQNGRLDLIREYLDQGGNMFWSSHEFFYSLYKYPNREDNVTTQPGEFPYDYLHVRTIEQDEYIYTATGETGTNLEGLTYRFEDVFSADPTGATDGGYQWWPDEFTTDGTPHIWLRAGLHEFPSAASEESREDALDEENILRNEACAISIETNYKIFFMSIPVQGIPMNGPGPYDRTEFMRTALTWLGADISIPPLGIDIGLSKDIIHAGEEFILAATISNPGPETYTDYPLAVLLDAYGFYFWYPSWQQAIDYRPITIDVGVQYYDLLRFPWPVVAGNAGGILFYGAILNPGLTELVGDFDYVSFGWEE